MKIESLWNSFKKVIWLVLVIWAVFLLSRFFPSVNDHGIVPRTVAGLPGILFAPFLHAGLVHIAGNTAGLLAMGFFMTVLDDDRLFYTLVPIVLIGGLGTWIIGRSGSNHLGASGMIFGMLGYLLASGFFRREIRSIVVSVLVFVLYGSMLMGVFPILPEVSWESHLCGFCAGVLTASGSRSIKRK